MTRETRAERTTAFSSRVTTINRGGSEGDQNRSSRRDSACQTRARHFLRFMSRRKQQDFDLLFLIEKWLIRRLRAAGEHCTGHKVHWKATTAVGKGSPPPGSAK